MKLMKRILQILCTFFMMITIVVVMCAINPEWSTKLSQLLYPSEKGKVTQTVVSTFPNVEYIAPKESEVRAPEVVAGKTGYQPVEEKTEVIEESAKEEILQSLGVGETGEGLEFSSEIYPYYAMLSKELQQLYRQIYANAMVLNDHFTPVVEVSLDQMKNVFTAVVCDHPELFWLDTAYQSRYLQSGSCVDLQLQFNQTARNLTESKQQFEDRAAQIINQAQGLGSDYEKEVAVHDGLIGQVEYNLNAPMNQSAYSALVNGQTVCAGYARAYQYILQQLGILCYYCVGFAGENHAWNIVFLEGEYYNVDTTWDDTDPNTYDYFNKTDQDFSTNHIRQDLSVYLPACNGGKYSNLLDLTEQTSLALLEEKRSLEEIGVGEEDVLYSLIDYQQVCIQTMMEHGLGVFSFQTIIKGEEIEKGMYQDDYLDQLIGDMGGSNIEVAFEGEELQNGYWLVTHKVSAR